MRKSLRRQGSPLPDPTGLNSYSNSKRLLDELYDVFVSYRPNCTVCEKSIGKLSEHILSSHGHGLDRSPKSHRKHSSSSHKIPDSENPEQFSQSTPTDTPTRNLRIRLKRVDYTEPSGIGAGDEILPTSTSQSPPTKKLKSLVLPYKSPPRQKAIPTTSASLSNYDIPSNVLTTDNRGQGHDDLLHLNELHATELTEPEGVKIKCEIDIDHEFEYIINNPDPDPGFIVGDLNYEIDPEFMNLSVQEPENHDMGVDDDPDDFEGNQEYAEASEPEQVEARSESEESEDDDDDDSDVEYGRKIKSSRKKQKGRSSPTKRKLKREVRAFACDQCPRNYAYHRDLIHHFRTVHPDTTEKPFQCPRCDERFFGKILLRKHIVREHEGNVTIVTDRARKTRITKTSSGDGDPDFEVTQEYTGTEADDPEDAEISSQDDDNDPEYSEKKNFFKTKSKPSNRQRKWKRKVRAFACDQCDRKYAYHRDLVTHWRTVHADTTEKPYPCPSCEERCFSKILLKRHIMRVHEENGGDEESRRENSRKAMAKPKTTSRSHKKDLRTHACTECPRKYAHHRDLITHRRTAHPDTTEKPFVCPIPTCQMKFFSRKPLRVHMSESHPDNEIHFCKKCRVAGFASESDLQIHIETHVSGDEPYMCEQCGKTFVAEVSLDRHVKLHSMKGRVRVPRPHCVRKSRPEGAYACTLCPRKYTYHRDLITHTRANHPDAADKPYICHVCGQKYFSNLQLKKHVRETHPGINPYVCSYCRKGYWKESEYLVHKQTHTDEKRYTCEYCGRGFPLRAKLVRHIKVHTGEKPHMCEICGKSYGTSEYLTIHKRSHTGERPYVCAVCGASFTGKTALNKHSTIHK